MECHKCAEVFHMHGRGLGGGGVGASQVQIQDIIVVAD